MFSFSLSLAKSCFTEMWIIPCFLLFAEFLIISVSSDGFILNEVTMDAGTYEACSTCDGRLVERETSKIGNVKPISLLFITVLCIIAQG